MAEFRRRWWRLILWPIGIVILLVGSLWLFQRRLIYFPDRTVGAAPSGWVEETLTTSDGLRLGAWFAAPSSGGPVVVVFNGNAGNRAGRVLLGSALVDEGLGVLLVDYRGYGGNEGRPSEAGLARDARAAAAFVAERAPSSPLVLFGESLGTAVALELAVEVVPAAVILRSPFTSMADVAGVHYPLLPASLLLRDEYPSRDRIGALRSPLLVIAGSDDSIIPMEQSRELYDLAPDPKRWLLIEGADHNDFELLAGRELIDAAVMFVNDAVAPGDESRGRGDG